MKRRRKGTKRPSQNKAGRGRSPLVNPHLVTGSTGETGCAAPGRGERGCMNRTGGRSPRKEKEKKRRKKEKKSNENEN